MTSVGHYAVDIIPKDNRAAEEVLLALPEETKDKENILRKLHRQFGHPREEVMLSLLKKKKCSDKETQKLVATIHENCMTCKQFTHSTMT